MRSGVLTSISSRQRITISGCLLPKRTDFAILWWKSHKHISFWLKTCICQRDMVHKVCLNLTGLCSAEERRKNIEDLHDEVKTMKRRHATSIKVWLLVCWCQCTTNHSAFYPYGVSKSSAGLSRWDKGGHFHLCRAAGTRDNSEYGTGAWFSASKFSGGLC